MIRTSMKAAVFYGPVDIRLEDQPIRLPGSGEILVQVAACGVCGTDYHIYAGEKGSAATPAGTVLGHEFAGIVAAVGHDVDNFLPGDHVAIDPNDYCGHCLYCRTGRAHFCVNMVGIGTTVNGGFAEYCTIRAKQAYLLPARMKLTAAAMAEPVACCLHALDMAALKPGSRVLIIGGGTIGLLMLQLVRLNGAAGVAVIEPVTAKEEICRALGADLFIDPLREDSAKRLAEEGFAQIDLTIECVGTGNTMLDAIRLVSRGGTALLFGLTAPDCEITVKPFEIFERELKLLGSYINPYTIDRAVSLLAGGRIRTDPLIACNLKLGDISQAFTEPGLRRQGKVMILPHQD